MNLFEIKQAFTGPGHNRNPGGRERHNLTSLSRRLMVDKGTAARLLKSGSLEFEASFSAGEGRQSWEFSSGHLNQARGDVVESCIREIVDRLQGSGMTDDEIHLAVRQSLRCQKESVEQEFASKPNDDEKTSTGRTALIGAAGLGLAGAVLGHKVDGRIAAKMDQFVRVGRITRSLAGKPVGLIGGALGGAGLGHEIGNDDRKRNVVFPAAAGALGVAAYAGAKARGGVPAVAKKMIRDYAGVRDVARLRGVQVDIAKAGAAARDALFPSFKKVLRQTKMPWG